jgi:hypothetical protein
MYAEAVNELQQKWTLYGDPTFAQALERVYATSGYPATVREELNRMLQNSAGGQYADPVGIAECYAELGDQSHAFQWLQKGYEEHSSSMQYLMVSAGFDSIRSSTPFQYWRGVVGLPASVNIESNR